MSKTIEIPDPLFSEIDDYANQIVESPVSVIRQAWGEFRRQRPQNLESASARKPSPAELLVKVRSLRG